MYAVGCQLLQGPNKERRVSIGVEGWALPTRNPFFV